MALNLKSMKIKPKSDKELDGPRSQYGYGLNIYVADEHLKTLGLSKPLPVGTIVTIEAKAIVESTRESAEARAGDGDEDKVDMSMSLQITDMALEEQGEADNPAEILYSNS